MQAKLLRAFFGSLFMAGFMAVVFAEPAMAYIGPGAGLSAIGTFLALVFAVLVAIVGFFWYPIKRLVKGRKKGIVEEEETSGDTSPNE